MRIISLFYILFLLSTVIQLSIANVSFAASPPPYLENEFTSNSPEMEHTNTGKENFKNYNNSDINAINFATEYVRSDFQKWLNGFGTARVQVSPSNKKGWNESSLDILYPMFDGDKSIIFAQMGVRAPNGRFISNFGTGIRTYYVDNLMLGGNVFIDNDFSTQNRRIGIGTEIWIDYLKLSMNSYIPISDWHTSKDLKDHYEKPAHGFDLRAEGYLPSWPNLGAKFTYEKYYGNNVGLFDSDNLQDNPTSITTGLSYTPISMITTGIDYRHSSSLISEFNFNVIFKYQFGRSFLSQMSTEQVKNDRMISGSRHDLVERNNKITLRYKNSNEDVNTQIANFTLNLLKDNSPADGIAENKIHLHAENVNGEAIKNSIISWSVSGHGKLSSFSGVTDVNGDAWVNLTNTTKEIVSVTATIGSLTKKINSSFVNFQTNLDFRITKNNSFADGNDVNKGIISLKDSDGKGIPDVSVNWQVNNGAIIKSSDKTTDSRGQATIAFSSTQAGTVKLVATAGDRDGEATATFTKVPVSSIAVTMTTDHSPADGTTKNVALARVVSVDNKPVSGIKVVWAVGGSAVNTTPLTTTTNADGLASISLTDEIAESVIIIASTGDQTGQTKSTFNKVPVANVTVSLVVNWSPADSTSTNVAQVYVTTAGNKPVPDAEVAWTISGNAKNTTPLNTKTNSSGLATLSFKNDIPESVIVTATVEGQSGHTRADFDIGIGAN